MVKFSQNSRGQIILIGAIALAVIIAGLAVTINSVLISEVQPGSNDLELVEDGAVYRQEIATSLQRLNASIADPNDLRRNTTTYARLLRNSTIRQSGASVDITVVSTEPTIFRYTYESRRSRFTTTINTTKVGTPP